MMTATGIGILGGCFLLMLLIGSMPVAFAMGLVGGIGFWCLRGFPAASYMMTGELLSNFSNGDLTVIPLFIFMGQVSFHSGISRRLFDTAYRWLGALPGGLAMATVGACTAFGAICGSGPATAATMAAVAMPEMRRHNYSMELAGGAVASGGSLGMLIPPSVVFIVYGIMTEQSPGQLFIAGILPGLFIALLFCLGILVNCLRNPQLGPASPAFSWKERIRSLGGVGETLALFVLVIGGMFCGYFTPVEAAAIGAAGSLVVAAFRRKLSFAILKRSLLETARTSCMVMSIVACAMMFGRFLAVTGIPVKMAQGLTALPLPGAVIMAGILLFYLVAGCFVDALALILLTIPVFHPVVMGLNYDPIWFGVMVVVVTQMGVISPPVGINAYVVSGIERDVPLQTVFKGTMPFLGILILSAALLMIFPEICLYLPNNGPRAMMPLLGAGAVILGQALVVFRIGRLLRLPQATFATALAAVTLKLSLVLLVVRWLPADSANSLRLAIVFPLGFLGVVSLTRRFWGCTYARAALVGIGYSVFSILLFVAGQHCVSQLPLQLF